MTVSRWLSRRDDRIDATNANFTRAEVADKGITLRDEDEEQDHDVDDHGHEHLVGSHLGSAPHNLLAQAGAELDGWCRGRSDKVRRLQRSVVMKVG